MSIKEPKGALAGVRVIDLTHAYNGPFCTMHLADHGAEVIKIEKPLVGDMTREWPPIKNGESGYFGNLNRNKKSVTLDIKQERDKAIFKELVKTADVVVDNFRPGTMSRLGLGYEVLVELNPRIIMAESSGFGQYGPLKDRPAYDVIAQSMGGICSITGYPDGLPIKVGPAIADNYTGTYLALGIILALYNREKTGRGQQVDVAMLDTVFSVLENAIPVYAVTGETLGRTGYVDPATSPYDLFECQDGHLVIACANNNTFNRLCKLMNKANLIEHPDYCSNDKRCENRSQLTKIIAAWTITKSKDEIEPLLVAEGVPVASILNIAQAANHPQIIAREMLVEIEHPVIGPTKYQGVPIKLSKTPGAVCSPAPLLGQHTAEVLLSLGISPINNQDFSEQKVI
ncbi:MAG: bile acid-inducible operon protein F [Peptococcaceae bacterium BRH_c8a]|nr:MAG: bile acid-inducible operon protein F [Peptococcaceae bacterium BRH_c8a]